jgi:hypothetical protein
VVNLIPLGVALLAGGALFSLSRGGAVGESSQREDMAESTTVSTAGTGGASVLLAAVGWLYLWGGAPVTTWAAAVALGAAGKGVVDCSLFCSLALVKLGIRKTFKRYTSGTLAAACDPVPFGKQRPGDVAIYPGHVMMVLSDPDAKGDSRVIGASGGGSKTRGDDPNARVKTFDSAKYRKDFVCFGRLKAAERG